jgi:biopolymer transport protein ExbD
MRLSAVGGSRRMTIALTPLIDVVFILLFFFMLASKFDHRATLSLSSAGGAPEQRVTPNHEQLLLVLGVNGEILANGKLLDREALNQRLDTLTRAADASVVIQPSRDVAVQHLVSLIDIVESTGLRSHIEHLRR